MIETEIKIMLTSDEYSFLSEYFSMNGESCFQTNHYYDTVDYHFNSKRITCRIREKDKRYVATVKVHNYEGNPNDSFERSRVVQDQWDKSLFEDFDVRYQGYMNTKRITINAFPDITIMLDKNTYLDIEDFELEVECSATSKNSALQFVDSIAELLTQQRYISSKSCFSLRISETESKSCRFMKRKQEIESE